MKNIFLENTYTWSVCTYANFLQKTHFILGYKKEKDLTAYRTKNTYYFSEICLLYLPKYMVFWSKISYVHSSNRYLTVLFGKKNWDLKICILKIFKKELVLGCKNKFLPRESLFARHLWIISMYFCNNK
jgi:hypothetical protein